ALRDLPSFPTRRSSDLADFAQGGGERLEVLAAAVGGERCAHGGGHAEPAQERLRAEMAGAYRHALLIEDGADIVRVHAVHGEGRSEEHTSELQSPYDLV